MGVEHELAKRAVHTRHSARHQNKTATSQFGGCFKVHTGDDSSDFKMLDWIKSKVWQVAVLIHLDVVCLVFAIRDIGVRQVRQGQHQCVQRDTGLLGLFV